MQKNRILVYFDTGVGPFSLKQSIVSLKSNLDGYKIEVVRGKDLKKSDWIKDTKLLVIPGGRDLPYHQTLTGDGNKNIRTFVENGGSYLGICAGAYFGSKKVIFHKDHPSLEIYGDRELSFFPDSTYGPIYNADKFDYHSEAGGCSAQIDFQGNQLHAYYNGGCSFENPEEHENTTVLSHYIDKDKNNPAAIVMCRVNEGTAILSGVHIEYNYNALEGKKIPEEILSHLEKAEQKRQKLFKDILEKLL